MASAGRLRRASEAEVSKGVCGERGRRRRATASAGEQRRQRRSRRGRRRSSRRVPMPTLGVRHLVDAALKSPSPSGIGISVIPLLLIDPSEKLDPEVEDILIDIAEEFVESITSFGCSLAKHRRSTTLEAKDILLHLEINWNMTLPGFGGDEIKIYKKPLTNDIHRERLTVVRKSIDGAEMGNTKVQPSANSKGHVTKGLPNASAP